MLNNAFSSYQLGDLDKAELLFRKEILKNPMNADARAALSALLWNKGLIGEATSNWAPVDGLDMHYRQKDWLLNNRHWPSKPVSDLMSLLAFESK